MKNVSKNITNSNTKLHVARTTTHFVSASTLITATLEYADIPSTDRTSPVYPLQPL